MYDVKPDQVGWTVYNAETDQSPVLDGATLTELEYEAADVLACLLNRRVYGPRQKPLSRWSLMPFMDRRESGTRHPPRGRFIFASVPH
jgi:hypothetical protein